MMENLSKSIPNDKAGDQDRTKNDMKSPKEFLAFLQTWQFFGMLEMVFDRPIQLSEFTRRVDDSGPLAVTTARLLPLLKDWLDHDGPAAYQQPLHKLHPP
jgi:hypothetical protein